MAAFAAAGIASSVVASSTTSRRPSAATLKSRDLPFSVLSISYCSMPSSVSFAMFLIAPPFSASSTVFWTLGGRSFNCSAFGCAAWANGYSPQSPVMTHAANSDTSVRIPTFLSAEGTARDLFTDHDDRERARDGGAAASAAAAGRRWCPRGRRRRRWPDLRCHREEMAGLAVKRDGARAVRRPRLQVLLHLETRGALLLDDRHRAVALRAEGFHGRRIERRAVGTAGERQPREDGPVLRAQDDKRLRRLGVRIGRRRRRRRLSRRSPRRGRAHGGTRGEQDLVLH